MFCESWGVCDFPDPEGWMSGLPAKRQRWQQWASCLALPKALPATAGGQVVLKKDYSLCNWTSAPEALLPLHSRWKKNVAVTLVSGSDDIFSSLSSNGAERSGTFKRNQTIRRAFAGPLSDVAGRRECICTLVVALMIYLLGLAL